MSFAHQSGLMLHWPGQLKIDAMRTQDRRGVMVRPARGGTYGQTVKEPVE